MRRILLFFINLFIAIVSWAQTPISGTINTYAAVNAINTGACSASIFTVDDASSFNVNDTVLIIQMQGATIDVSNTASFGDITAIGNAGNYEKNVISAKSGNTLTIGFQLVNSYDVAGKVQIVRIPHYTGNVNVNGTLTAAAWDGNKGGVLAFTCSGDVSMTSNIDVRTKGFRGGANVLVSTYSCTFITQRNAYFYPLNTENGAGKGEGIASFITGYECGRGKNANGGGGGNDHNAGGAGGGNATAGGNGGINNEPGNFNCQGDFPGLGALGLNYGNLKMFMGGGGGAGHGNNAAYTAANGAGIVYIKASSVSGTILANGSNGTLVSNDGGNGGSAGGTVFLEVNSWSAGLTVNVSGGNGGNTANIGNRCYGPGGGGGIGAFLYNQASFTGTLSANPGNAGVVTTSTNACNGSNLGATNGGNASIEIPNSLIPFSNIPTSSGASIYPGNLVSPLTICESGNFTYAPNADTGYFYQWQIDSTGIWENLANGANYTGVTTMDQFTIVNALLAMNEYDYRMLVYTNCDTAISNVAQVIVNPKPRIQVQPNPQTSCVGGDAFFYVESTDGTTFQWQIFNAGWQNLTNSADIVGADNDSLYLYNIPGSYNGALFRIRITNSCGFVISTFVQLTLSNIPISAMIVPDTLNLCVGEDSIMYLNTTGSIDSIQWQQNTGSGFANLIDNADFQGVHNDTLQFIGVSAVENNYTYRALIFDNCGNASVSDTAILKVYPSPSVSLGANPTICQGQGVFVSISNFTGSGVSYQWQVDSTGGTWENLSNINGYSNTTGNFLGIASSITTPSLNSNFYRVVITTDCGSATSNTIQINVIAPPTIAAQAQNDTVCLGNNATFAITANNVNTYQWQSNVSGSFTNLTNNATFSGVNTSTLNITNVSAALAAAQYRVVLTGTAPCGNTTSQSASIILSDQDSITAQSSNTIICENTDTLFFINSSGSAAAVQWQMNAGSGFSNLSNNSNFSGVSNDSLFLSNIPFAFNNYQFRALFTDFCGSQDTSAPILLQINQLPSINSQASSQTICLGDSTSFSITASSNTTSFQWQVNAGSGFTNVTNSSIYNGVNTATLQLNNPPQTFNNNQYRIIAGNSCGNDTSNTYALQFFASPLFSQNLSICQGDTLFLSNGTALFANGTYYDTLQNGYINGCDSVYEVLLTVNQIPLNTLSQSICQGDTFYMPSGNSFTANGIYSDTLSNASAQGCDSIYQVNLNVLPIAIFNNPQSICSNESYTLPGGTTVNTAGTYNDTLTNAATNSCDSIVITQLSILNLATFAYNDSFCTNAPYTLPSGNQVTIGGVYNDTLFGMAANSCDSVNIITLYENQTFPPIVSNDTICLNDNYTLPDGSIVTLAGIYSDTIPSSNGCDSVWVVNLYNKPNNSIVAQSNNQSFCAGDNLTLFASSQLSNVSYQWQENGSNIPGANNDTLLLNNVLSAQSGNSYTMFVYGECDTVVSSPISIQEKLSVTFTTPLLNDTICEGTSTQFTVNTSGNVSSLQWYENNQLLNGANTSTLNVSNVTMPMNGNSYFCIATDSCGNTIYSDTAYLFVNPLPSVTEGILAQTVCEGEDFIFYISSTNANQVQWNENNNILPFHQTDTMLMVNATANMNGYIYFCDVTNNCGTLRSDTFIINVNQEVLIVNQSDDFSQCGGFNFNLFVSSNTPSTYQWQINTGSGFTNLTNGSITAPDAFISGAQNDTLTVSNYNIDISNATFQVIVNNPCGASPVSNPIQITITEPVALNNTLNDTSICLHELSPIQVNYVATNAIWSNGNLGQVFLPEETGLYTVSFIDTNNCPNADSIYIELLDCIAACLITAPTGFSPNNSGINDVFRAIYGCSLDFYQLSVYNRWGELVFFTNDVLQGWDGTYKGKDAEIGTYTWTIEYTKEFTNKKESISGNVTLIR